MIKRVGEHFRAVRMRADSGYYDQKLVQICAARGVEFFIVAKKHANVMKRGDRRPDAGASTGPRASPILLP